MRGFSASNLWRMRQLFETYRDQPILSTALRELAWSSHLHILARAKRPEERESYLRLQKRLTFLRILSAVFIHTKGIALVFV